MKKSSFTFYAMSTIGYKAIVTVARVPRLPHWLSQHGQQHRTLLKALATRFVWLFRFEAQQGPWIAAVRVFEPLQISGVFCDTNSNEAPATDGLESAITILAVREFALRGCAQLGALNKWEQAASLTCAGFPRPVGHPGVR